ncbi:preprotein translocase subunit YajC [Oerskovia flava]|uniref:preprotein translocase subunit YajC n=1 Tax=Oerskovia flava TaxID=2986422 RepID=UPI00223F0730|nr:preprotein translocase subunit YajC [Oerskovia sp. JB1-3-2]
MEMIIILALAVGAMFLLTNRSRKQQREAANFRATLAPGQEVMTGSGLFGTVVDVDEERDIITIESTPGNQTRWLRAAIAKLVEPPVVEEEDSESVLEDDAVADLEPDPSVTTTAKDDVDVPDDLSSLTGTTDTTDDKRREDGTQSK